MSSGEIEKFMEIKYTIRHLSSDVFFYFQEQVPLNKDLYWLNESILTCAISDAFSDIQRAGTYHSPTGANITKKAAYIGKWLSHAKPIQIANIDISTTPQKEINILSSLNTSFAIYAMEGILGENVDLYGQLLLHLNYIFTFRPRVDADQIALLLDHALFLSTGKNHH